MADAIELSIYTGMRQNELETLIPLRVRLNERRVIVLAKRKARQEHRERSVFLNTAAVALLAERVTPGCDPGDVDGVWSDKAKRALAEFAHLSKVTLPNEGATSEALQAVLRQKGRICGIQCGPHEIEKDGRCVARVKPGPTRARVSEETRRRPEAASEHKSKCWRPHGVGANYPLVCPQ